MRRTILSFAVLGAVLSSPVMAQTSGTSTQPSYMVPMYVSPNGTQAYGSQGGAVPMYNPNAQPMPMRQMIAGKNAPSYNYNNQAYTGYNSSGSPLSNVTSMGSLSPQQMQYVQQQQTAQALAYQNEYLASLQQDQGQAQPVQQQAASNSSKYQGKAFSGLYNSNQQKKPSKRKVIYKEMNNPLQTPPRLFNPDQ